MLQAWRDFPKEFSLRNHPEHPDGSEIHKRLYQGLGPKGYIVSLGSKVFRLTDAGLQEARRLRDGHAPLPDGEALTRLGREEESVFQHARQSPAFAAWERGEGPQLIDYDARMFFEFSTGTPYGERRRRVERSLTALRKAVELHRTEDCGKLLTFAEALAERFQPLWKG